MTKPVAAEKAAVPAIAIAKPIFVLVAANPKKPGSKSAARFALYATNDTVAAYVAACVKAGQSRRNATADIAWDLKHGFIAHTKPAA